MKTVEDVGVERSGLSLRPWSASLLIVCAGVGAMVVISALTLAMVPVLIVSAVVLALLIGALACGWAGIEALAALERWIESDARFHR